MYCLFVLNTRNWSGVIKLERKFHAEKDMQYLSRAEISQTYHQGEEAVIALVETLQNALKRMEILEGRIAMLEGQTKKNSGNSSKPPSSDGLRRTVSERTASGKKPGGQAEHPGRTLERSASPDEIIRHSVASVCPQCSTSLSDVAAEVVESRQVMDVPKVSVHVTEHQVEAKTCPCCQARHKASFPVHVVSPVQYGQRVSALAVYLNVYHLVPRERTVEILEELCGIALSNGTLENMLERAFDATEEAEEHIKEAIIHSHAIHADETGARIAGKTQWIHTASTEQWTHYHPSFHRGKDAHAETGILEQFAQSAAQSGGVLHSDFYASYHGYICHHAYCNAHLLRNLRFLADVRKHPWATQMRELLRETLHALHQHQHASNNPHARLDEQTIRSIETRYDELVEAALRLHPRSTERENGTTKGRIKQSEERLLAERLLLHKADILRFATDPYAVFDNNLAERDLRMIKVQQKISGSFRSMNGAMVFCRLRGFCSTLRKQAINILDALFDVFSNKNVQFQF